jgi:hypothetical protein
MCDCKGSNTVSTSRGFHMRNSLLLGRVSYAKFLSAYEGEKFSYANTGFHMRNSPTNHMEPMLRAQTKMESDMTNSLTLAQTLTLTITLTLTLILTLTLHDTNMCRGSTQSDLGDAHPQHRIPIQIRNRSAALHLPSRQKVRLGQQQ